MFTKFVHMGLKFPIRILYTTTNIGLVLQTIGTVKQSLLRLMTEICSLYNNMQLNVMTETTMLLKDRSE